LVSAVVLHFHNFLSFFPHFLDGADKVVPVNKETCITVDASEAGNGKVTCRIRSPTGSDIDIDIIDRGDGTFTISFTPQFPGDYTIEIKFGGNLVPQGEYTITVGAFFFIHFILFFFEH
jgi:filamin